MDLNRQGAKFIVSVIPNAVRNLTFSMRFLTAFGMTKNILAVKNPPPASPHPGDREKVFFP
jgi:hypothetical protein